MTSRILPTSLGVYSTEYLDSETASIADGTAFRDGDKTRTSKVVGCGP